jgi:hypothetical protein
MSGSVLSPMQRIIIAAAQRQPGRYWARLGLTVLIEKEAICLYIKVLCPILPRS